MSIRSLPVTTQIASLMLDRMVDDRPDSHFAVVKVGAARELAYVKEVHPDGHTTMHGREETPASTARHNRMLLGMDLLGGAESAHHDS